MLKRFLFICLIILLVLSSNAKDKGKPEKSRPVRFSNDVGLLIGGAYYLGELNPSKHFYMMQPALGLFYRYNQNYRFSYLVGMNFGSIMGDDSQSDDIDQLNRNLNFKSKLKVSQRRRLIQNFYLRINNFTCCTSKTNLK